MLNLQQVLKYPTNNVDTTELCFETTKLESTPQNISRQEEKEVHIL